MATSGFANEQPDFREPRPYYGARGTPRTRAASVLLAAGAFVFLADAVFLLPFAVSSNAMQNDVYMGNLFLAPLLFVVSIACLLAGVIRMGQMRELHGRRAGLVWRALLLAVLGGGAVFAATFLVGGRYYSAGPNASDWPPYLNLPLLAAAVAIGIGVCVAAWLWSPDLPAQNDAMN